MGYVVFQSAVNFYSLLLPPIRSSNPIKPWKIVWPQRERKTFFWLVGQFSERLTQHCVRGGDSHVTRNCLPLWRLSRPRGLEMRPRMLCPSFTAYFRPPSQHEEVNRRRTRTNILLASITIVFFVCWAPLVIFSLIYDFGRHLLPERAVMASFAYTLSLLSGMLTPIINPVLYSLLNESFREIVRKKFCKWCRNVARSRNNGLGLDATNDLEATTVFGTASTPQPRTASPLPSIGLRQPLLLKNCHIRNNSNSLSVSFSVASGEAVGNGSANANGSCVKIVGVDKQTMVTSAEAAKRNLKPEANFEAANNKKRPTTLNLDLEATTSSKPTRSISFSSRDDAALIEEKDVKQRPTRLLETSFWVKDNSLTIFYLLLAVVVDAYTTKVILEKVMWSFF